MSTRYLEKHLSYDPDILRTISGQRLNDLIKFGAKSVTNGRLILPLTL